jgi:hypothetical protein
VKDHKNAYLFLALAILFCSRPPIQAQKLQHNEPVLQLCAEYSSAGDLLTASVFAHSFSVTVAHPTGQVVELTEKLPEVVTNPNPFVSTVPCQLAVAAKSDRVALGIPTGGGVVLELIDVNTGRLTHTVRVPNKFQIQFPMHPMGFIGLTDSIAISHVHYRPTSELEVATELINRDGLITPVPNSVLGPKYAEIGASSFDFRDGRVWFLCPVYAVRWDRQPPCTLTSAPLIEPSSPSKEIPPAPNARMIGAGQPQLGFPSSDVAILLAQGRIWLYHFTDNSFGQTDIPETPHHIRWAEFPGGPKFSSDGRFAAVPVNMYHYPLFQEGQVPHGTKIVIVELPTLHIVDTIQPTDEHNLIDFALHNDGRGLTLQASWGKDWRSFHIPTARDSNNTSVRADAARTMP